MKRWISSTACRLLAKQIVRRPCSTKVASSRDASPSELARTPRSGSSSSGFQRAIVRSVARCGVAVDDFRRFAEQRLGQLRRVRDGRGGEDELRLGAVRPREPAQPPEDVRDVRAEDAAVDVRLVDDDVAEVREHVAPAVVVREHAHVEHVGVRQDRVGPLADLPAALALGVAVVDRGLDALDAERCKARAWSCASAFVG